MTQADTRCFNCGNRAKFVRMIPALNHDTREWGPVEQPLCGIHAKNPRTPWWFIPEYDSFPVDMRPMIDAMFTEVAPRPIGGTP